MQNKPHIYKHYIIYKITNLINGFIYIGKHKTDRLDDKYFGSGKLLHQAFKEFGIENFMFHLEFDLHNQAEMDLLERLVVNKEFLRRNDVYNISLGGYNPCLFGKNNPFYGKKHSTKTRKKISLIHKGIPLTESHKLHISEGEKLMYKEDPKQLARCNTMGGKKKCINPMTGDIQFFKANKIPKGYKVYVRPPPPKVSEEQKAKTRAERSKRASSSRWYNNGMDEIFCIEGTQPIGFERGRLPGLNAGRPCSQETRKKIRQSNLGKKAPNKEMKFITDGIINTYIKVGDPMPKGFHYGMRPRSK